MICSADALFMVDDKRSNSIKLSFVLVGWIKNIVFSLTFSFTWMAVSPSANLFCFFESKRNMKERGKKRKTCQSSNPPIEYEVHQLPSERALD